MRIRRRLARAVARAPIAILAALLPDDRREPAIGDLLEAYRRERPKRPLRWLGRECSSLAWFHLTTPGPPRPRNVPRGDHRMVSRLASDLSADLRHALRLARRQPAFTAFALAILTLGIGANSALFSVVDSLLFDALPFREVDRLVVLQEQQLERGIDGSNVSYPNYRDWIDGSDVFEASGAATPTTRNLGGRDGDEGTTPERLAATAITEGYLDTFGLSPFLGRGFSAADRRPSAEPVVLLAEGWWRERFAADPAIVGEILRLDGRPHTIVGVAPAHALQRETRIWIPLPSNETVLARTNHFLHAYARLRPGVSAAQAAEQLDVVAATLEREHPASNAGWRPLVQGLRETRTRNAAPLLGLLAGVVGLVLALACANVAGLLLSRASDREPEIAVRLALGAGRRRVLRQLVAEGLSLSVLAGVLGWLAGLGATRVLARRLAEDSPLPPPTLDPVVLAITLAVSVATGILFSLAPARAGLRASIARSMGSACGAASAFRPGTRGRAFLVSGQVAVALVLLSLAGSLALGLVRMQRTDLGFDPENLLTLRLDLPSERYPSLESRTEIVTRIREEVAALPGVESTATTSSLPFGGNRTARAVVRWGDTPDPEGDPGYVVFQSSSPGYLATLGIPLVAGRDFRSSDGPTSPAVAVINASLARRLFGRENAVGESVLVYSDEDRPRTVVGVIPDVRSHSLSRPVGPMLFVPDAQLNWTWHAMAVRSKRPPEELIPAIRRRVAAIDPDQPVYDLRTMGVRVGNQLTLPRTLSRLLGSFALVALILAATSLYALLSTAVRQRRREMAIRLALGARPGQLLHEVVGQGLRLAALGLAVGGSAGLLLTRLLGAQLPELGGQGAGATLGAIALLALVMGIASVRPALRASRQSPTASLRGD